MSRILIGKSVEVKSILFLHFVELDLFISVLVKSEVDRKSKYREQSTKQSVIKWHFDIINPVKIHKVSVFLASIREGKWRITLDNVDISFPDNHPCCFVGFVWREMALGVFAHYQMLPPVCNGSDFKMCVVNVEVSNFS